MYFYVATPVFTSEIGVREKIFWKNEKTSKNSAGERIIASATTSVIILTRHRLVWSFPAVVEGYIESYRLC